MIRKLGFSLHFKDASVLGLLRQKQHIYKALNLHGCICIKNIDFQPSQMVQFSKSFFKEVIELPSYLAFNNQDPTNKQVARVGNIKLDGTIKDSQKEAAYWHQDGDFWGKGNHIYNALHTRVIPDTGGQTFVMDLVEGAQYLKAKQPFLYQRIKQIIGALDLENIDDFKHYNAKNTLGIQTVSQHQLLSAFDQNLQKLYLSVHSLIQKNNRQPVKDIKIEQIHALLQQQMGFYSHKWQTGDLLIWDNIQVMHRSSGRFSGNRLLYRTQGRIK